MIQTIADRISGKPEIWSILENIVNSLVMSREGVSDDVLKAIDVLFNNTNINASIPLSFTATLCLLINSLYLVGNETPGGEQGVYEAYLSIMNDCYVLFNNVWSGFEARIEQNDFGGRGVWG